MAVGGTGVYRIGKKSRISVYVRSYLEVLSIVDDGEDAISG
jgi:hypothetical protein